MADPILRWQKSPSPNVAQYALAWTVNGAAVGGATVPVSADGDASGYQADFASANPSVVLNPSDVVGVGIAAVDTVNSLTSTVVTPSSVTVPAAPPPPPTAPAPPQNVTLSLS